MLSYRHAFHAGNHADVLKHFCVWRVLSHMLLKDKALYYVDTHAGAGVYDLHSAFAQKLSESAQGIQRIHQVQSPLLVAFMQMLSNLTPPHHYPGAIAIAAALLREKDSLRAFELHPSDFAAVRTLDSRARSCKIVREDGLKGLVALMPPPTRRALVLIDPSYERKTEYQDVLNTLSGCLKRFATGAYLVWYPCLSHEANRRFIHQLGALDVKFLQAELHVRAPSADGFGMHGSGMFIINPPWTLHDELKSVLPEMTALMGEVGAFWRLGPQ